MQMFHRLGFIDNRLDLLNRRLGELDVRLDQLASPPRDLVLRRKQMYYVIAMWACLVVSIYALWNNASEAAYFVGLAVFCSLMGRPRP
jgi:hypothetical protein